MIGTLLSMSVDLYLLSVCAFTVLIGHSGSAVEYDRGVWMFPCIQKICIVDKYLSVILPVCDTKSGKEHCSTKVSEKPYTRGIIS